MVLSSWKSLNFEDRRDGAKPSMIILHYTGMQTEEAALKRLCDPASKVSAHYFVSESGEALNLVEDSKRAWHAGISYWNGITDINSHSIGIEIVNPGHEFGYRPFPDAQVRAVISLCIRLMDRYAIRPVDVLGHSDIAPKRKEDPGELFPWKQLAIEGVGLWPHPNEMDCKAAEDLTDLQDLLTAYGYNPDVPYENLLTAFHRHFYPEKFLKDEGREKPDNVSAARLLSLVRMKHAA